MVASIMVRFFVCSAICGFIVIFNGCTAFKTFPQTARGGDTIALAVGSPDGMSRANTTAIFVSDSAPGSPVDLTSNIRSIFRLYADKNSEVYNPGGDARYIVNTSGHEPWITIVALDLPVGLPLGPGKIQFSTTATYPTIGSNINNLPVSIEIIPGTGSSSTFDYEYGLGASMTGDLTALESLPHAQVIPRYPQSTTWPSYGAIEVKMHVPTTLGIALDQTILRVIRDDMFIETQSDPALIYHHDSNQDLTVLFLSTQGLLKYFDPRFSIKLIDSPYLPISFSGTPSLTMVKYYDVDGNEVSGPSVGDYTVELR